MRRQQHRQKPQPPRRLRKQPKLRRLQSASAIPLPRTAVPKTARQRRQRNKRRVRVPTHALKHFVLSARWISLGLLLLTTYALILIGMDTNFYLTLIPVEGTFSIPPAEVVEASGLGGTHIFAADPGRAAARITELPGVISATVTLGWPNKALVQIKEDSPIAVWWEGGNEFWVTQNGRLIPARISALGLLQIESELPLASPMVVPGDMGEGEGAGEGEASMVEPEASIAFVPPQVLAGALQLRELRPNIDKLYYRPSSGLSYEDGRGWRVYFGTGTDMVQKLVVYETIVEDLLARQLTPVYISVSNQEKPYYLAHGDG